MLSGIKFGIDITPTVVFFLRDLTCFEHSSSLSPSTQHFVKLCGILVFTHIDLQADFPIGFVDMESVSVFQGEQRVHQTDIGINVRYGESLRRYVKSISQCCSQVRFRSSCPCFVLDKTNIGRLLREAHLHTKIFLSHTTHIAEKVDSFANGHNHSLLSYMSCF